MRSHARNNNTVICISTRLQQKIHTRNISIFKYRASLTFKLKHVTSTQLVLRSHVQHISLDYSVNMMWEKSINISFFRVPLGPLKIFDVLTCDESIDIQYGPLISWPPTN